MLVPQNKMGRKEKGKRQKDPAADEFESSDEDEQKENELRKKVCPHVGKAVNFNNIRKTLKISWVRVGQCTVCLRDKKTTAASGAKTLSNASARKTTGGFKKSLDAAEAKRQQAERLKADQLAAAKAQQMAALKLAEQKRKVMQAVKSESEDTTGPSIPADDFKGKKVEILDASENVIQIESDTKDKCDKKEEVSKQEEGKPSEPPTIWLCLKCGTQGCGENSPSNHSLAHYKTPRSDLHCLVINPQSWVIWCYECESDVFVDSHKKLYESLEFIKKTSELPSKQPLVPKSNLKNPLPPKDPKTIKPVGQAAVTLDNPLPRVKGLSNLGNTCFFNSVMQCLAQTHTLETQVGDQCLKNVSLTIPGVILPPNLDNEEDDCYKLLSTPPTNRKDSQSLIWLEDLNLKLTEGGPMTSALAGFFREMSQGSKIVTVNPGHLFGQVVKRSPQFRGFQQQDSHELLRHLMEGLRIEESKRQKSAILKHFGLSERTDPRTVAQHTRKKLQAYSRHASHTLFDRIFSGQLVSTVVCEECKHSSHIYESFLDLSLPVMEDKPHKPAKKNSGGLSSVNGDVVMNAAGEDRKTRTQFKNQKRKAKNNRRKNKNKNISVTETAGDEEKITQDIKESELGDEKKDSTVDDTVVESLSKDMDELEIEDNPAGVVQIVKVLEDADQSRIGAADAKVVNKFKKALHKKKDALDQKIIKEATEITTSDVPDLKDCSSSSVAAKAAAFNTQAIADAANKTKLVRGGKSDGTVWKDNYANDEDEEEDEEGYEEDNWEWDYGEGEQWDETKSKESENLKEDHDNVDISAAVPEHNQELVIQKPLVSLNPLPPESLLLFEREKSSEPEPNESADENDETGASSNGDVEDNDTEEEDKPPVYSENTEEMLNTLALVDPIQLRKDSMAPHMQELCRSISISETINVKNAEMQQLRLRHEWTARTLTSLAPRYQVSPAECSVYSCLNQFTQSELLTGSNKWACERCTLLAAAKTKPSDPPEKPKPVYSNAFKQLLIFCPPAILTLHLKRFQQTLSGCRKINKDISFPLELDLAPFCSSTCVATPTVAAGKHKLAYRLYGVVEHSGRLSGGHYTAFVKVRPVVDKTDGGNKFFAPPAAKAGDVPRLLEEIERKFTRLQEKNERRHVKKEEADSEETPVKPQPRRWYHVSDSSVNEVSEERVLKAQAYILFYERTS